MPFDAGALLARLGLDTKGFNAGLTSATAQTGKFDKSVIKSDKTLQGMSSTAAGIGKLMLTGLGFFVAIRAVTGFTRAITGSISAAADLEKSMANVATLVDTTVVNMDSLTDSVLEMTSEVLKSAEDLSAGLYQVFSAGVTDAGEAMDVLRVAAIAATAGLSTTLTSVDALTTIINAYGLEAKDATEISDLMFQTVKLGKTTFDQLAQAIGTVISPAASVGIELDELFASLATLTKGGINTMRATTALRATLLAVIKPMDSAKKEAKRLGLEWNVSALKAKGLVRFLTEIREATEGDTSAIAELFPNVRALNGVLALTGAQFEELIRIQEQFEDRAGSTQEAFGKQADTFASKSIKMTLASDRLSIAFGKIEVALLLEPLEKLTEFLETILEFSERFELKQIRGELKGISETIQFLVEQRGRGGFFGPSEEEIDELNIRIAKLSQEYSVLSDRAILLINILDKSKKSQDAVNASTEEATQQYNDLILGTGLLTRETEGLVDQLVKASQQLPSVFDQANQNLPTTIKLTQDQNELLDELIAKSKELGKTELQIFDMTIQGAADKLGALLASDQELTDKQREGLMAIFALREDLRSQEEQKAEEQSQKEIDRAKRVEDAKIRSIKAFNKQFENAGLTQLQIVERNEKRAIAKATAMGQETAQITKFFEEKKTQIKQQELQKQLSAAGTFASATGDLATNLNQLLINQGKEGSKDLFLIMKVAAIANAIVSTAVGVTRALELGIPLGPPAAALVGAAGAAQVAVIATTALAEGGLVESPVTTLLGEEGPEAVIPIEQGVAPIIEESVRNVAEEEEQRTGLTIINVNDERKLRAIVADQQARTSERVILNILGRRNNRTALGQNTLPGVL